MRVASWTALPFLLLSSGSRISMFRFFYCADSLNMLQLPETTATFSYGPNSGQLASAVAASTRASVGQMSLERIDRRTSAMRKQVKKRSTVNKYKIDGPIHLEGDYEEEDGDDDGDISNGDTGFSGWFLTQTPEWLPQLHTADNSGTDGTPSPEAEAIV